MKTIKIDFDPDTVKALIEMQNKVQKYIEFYNSIAKSAHQYCKTSSGIIAMISIKESIPNRSNNSLFQGWENLKYPMMNYSAQDLQIISEGDYPIQDLDEAKFLDSSKRKIGFKHPFPDNR